MFEQWQSRTPECACVCLLRGCDLLFWSAVCLWCSTDKRAYMICKQFIEQQFRGKARRRNCQYWFAVTLTERYGSHSDVGNPHRSFSLRSFKGYLTIHLNQREIRRNCLFEKMQMDVTHWEKPPGCNSRSTCFFSLFNPTGILEGHAAGAELLPFSLSVAAALDVCSQISPYFFIYFKWLPGDKHRY